MSKNLSELQENFTTDKNGIIVNAGKFEGETLATPFYYDIMLDGGTDVIEIKPSDRLAFEIEDKYNFVVIVESSSGFVSLSWHETQEDAEKEANELYIEGSIDFDDAE